MGLCLSEKYLVLTDTVINYNGVVYGISQNGKNYRHKVGVDGHSAYDKCSVNDDTVVKKRKHRADTCQPAADILESYGYIDYQDYE